MYNDDDKNFGKMNDVSLEKKKKKNSRCIIDSHLPIQWHPYLPTPLLGQDMTQGQFLSEV